MTHNHFIVPCISLLLFKALLYLLSLNIKINCCLHIWFWIPSWIGASGCVYLLYCCCMLFFFFFPTSMKSRKMKLHFSTSLVYLARLLFVTTLLYHTSQVLNPIPEGSFQILLFMCITTNSCHAVTHCWQSVVWYWDTQETWWSYNFIPSMGVS